MAFALRDLDRTTGRILYGFELSELGEADVVLAVRELHPAQDRSAHADERGRVDADPNRPCSREDLGQSQPSDLPPTVPSKVKAQGPRLVEAVGSDCPVELRVLIQSGLLPRRVDPHDDVEVARVQRDLTQQRGP